MLQKSLVVIAFSAMTLLALERPTHAFVSIISVQGNGVNTNNGANTWTNVVGGNAIVYPNSEQINWGETGAPVSEKSGLRYDGVVYPPPGITAPANNVDLGDIFHINEPIPAGTAVTSTTLVLDFDFTSTQNSIVTPFAQLINVSVAINETPNNPPGGICPDGGVPPCPDFITVTPIGQQIVPIPGSTEFLIFTPVFQLPNGTQSNVIISPEGGTNQLDLRANFTVAPAPAPLAGLAVLSLFSSKIMRLRKKLITRAA